MTNSDDYEHVDTGTGPVTGGGDDVETTIRDGDYGTDDEIPADPTIDLETEQELRAACDGDPDRIVQIGPWRGPAWKREGFKRELERRDETQAAAFGDYIDAYIGGMDKAEFLRETARRNQLERAKEQERLAMEKAALEKRQQEIAASRNRDEALMDAAADLEQQQQQTLEDAMDRLDEMIEADSHVWANEDGLGTHPAVADAATALNETPEQIIERLRDQHPDAPEWQFMSKPKAERRGLK